MKKRILTLTLCILIHITNAYSQPTVANASSGMIDNRVNNTIDNSINNLKYAIPNKNGVLVNQDSKNVSFDNQGNRTGYQIKDASGATDYYDNNGNRIGSIPSK